jgi:hypothetical protein
LGFFEVRGHPNFVGLGHEHQRLAGFYPRAKLDRTSADDAVGRCVDFV